jgi:hypothetical protein
MSYICNWCNNSYHRRKALNAHELLCEIKYRGPNKIDEVELPSQKEMFYMITELAYKCRKLESKVSAIDKFVERKKRKIDILDYLNNPEREKPEYDFFDFVESQITTKQENLEILFEKNYAETFRNVLENVEKENNIKMSIQCHSQSQNKIFIFSKSRNLFEEISKEDLTKFCNIVHIKILKEMMAWRVKIGEEKVDRDTILSLKYNNSLLKIIKADIDSDASLNKYKKIIHECFSYDMNF